MKPTPIPPGGKPDLPACDAIAKPSKGQAKAAARRSVALQTANQELHRQITARHLLEKEILEITETERRRIGRDLHDDLGQRLVGISYLSQVLSSSLASRRSPDADLAAKITRLLHEALSLTRSLARGLDPVALQSGGLTSAFAELADRTSEMFLVDCQYLGPQAETIFSDKAATHLYRIAQEAVTNAVSHGKASIVRIEWIPTPAQATLRITDNGTGLDAAEATEPPHQGMGLRIMQYRASSIGASLEFSAPDLGGTCITCVVPASARPLP
jgi:signal transduction histidine kinase